MLGKIVLVVLCMIALEFGVSFGAFVAVGISKCVGELVVAVASMVKIDLACIQVR